MRERRRGFSLSGIDSAEIGPAATNPDRLNRLRKKCLGCHSERSEESLLLQDNRRRGILRAKTALRM